MTEGGVLNLIPGQTYRDEFGEPLDDEKLALKVQRGEFLEGDQDINDPQLLDDADDIGRGMAVEHELVDYQRKHDQEAYQKEKDQIERNARQREAVLKRELDDAKRPLQMVKKIYDFDDLNDYSRWYKFIPTWVGDLKKYKLQNLIDKLVEKEAKYKSEYELEEKIKKLIGELKTKRSPRRKSPKRKSKSKSPKRKSKSPKRKSKSPKKTSKRKVMKKR